MTKILIVDDEFSFVELVKGLLDIWGHPVDFVTEAERLFPKLEEETYDLILLDVNMPGTDGVTQLKRLKAHPVYQTIPVIMLTGIASDQLLADCLEYGATDFVNKPINMLVLKARVESALATQTYITEIQQQKKALEERTAQLNQVNKQLRQEISERNQVEQALRESEARFAGILDITPEAIISVDEKYCVLIFNKGAEQIFGYKAAEIIGQSLDLLIPEKIRANHQKYIAEFAASSTVARIMGERQEIAGRRQNGEEFPAAASISKLEVGGQTIFTVVLRDITRRKQAEEELKKHREHLEELVQERTIKLIETNANLQQEIAERKRAEQKLAQRAMELSTMLQATQAVSSTLNLKEVLTLIAQQIGPAVDATSAYICSFEAETLTSTVLAEYISPQACTLEQVSDLGVTYEENDDRFLQPMLKGEFWVDQLDDPILPKEARQVMELYGAHSILYVPLYIRGRTIGYAELWESRRRREFTLEEISLCQAIARQAAIAVENAQLYERIQNYAEKLEQRVADLKQAEEALRENEERYRNIFQTAAVSLWEEDISQLRAAIDELKDQGVTDFQTYLAEHPEFVYQAAQMIKVLDVNEATLKMYGAKSKDELMRALNKVFMPDAFEIFQKEIIAIAQGKTHFEAEVITQTLQEVRLDILIALMIPSDTAKYDKMLVSIMDITERKQAEEQIKASLAEKEVLLKEVHHRVKNNLQVISSLLDLQAGYIEDEQAREMFKESQHRIRSMALVHERLYQTKNLSKINFAEYVQNLTNYLLRSYGVGDVSLRNDIAPVSLSIETAIPCGLIINELVSNVMKHAFPPDADQAGEIHIELQVLENQQATAGYQLALLVKDNGVGFPPDMDFRHTKSLGLQLVITLVKQIEGTIELQSENGTEFKIMFTDLTAKI